jgi:formylmethanofuran dehydrogenase subunit C
MLKLRPKKHFTFPVTADSLCPEVLTSKTLSEIEKLSLWEGNKQREFGQLFKIDETGKTELKLAIVGDVSKVRRIGAGMKTGELTIRGNAGTHLGEKMKGGKITVHGNVEGWTGSMMSGGVIEIQGNVSDYLGAPYRGSTNGMRGGSITVHGNVGNQAGARMKRGTIRVYGNVGQFAGFRMREGTICIYGNCESRAGACMLGGKIVIVDALESMLPTFTIESVKSKVKIDDDQSAAGPFYVFIGDRSEEGNGKLYVSKDKNPQLREFEGLLQGETNP